MFPPPRQAGDESLRTGYSGARHHDWIVRVACRAARIAEGPNATITSTWSAGPTRRQVGEAVFLPLRPTVLNGRHLALDISRVAGGGGSQPLPEGIDKGS